jgi:hypothetical protein
MFVQFRFEMAIHFCEWEFMYVVISKIDPLNISTYNRLNSFGPSDKN